MRQVILFINVLKFCCENEFGSLDFFAPCIIQDDLPVRTVLSLATAYRFIASFP